FFSFSLCLSWKRILCIIFLPPVLSGFAPPVKDKEDFLFANAHMINWSYLTPLNLMDRSVGLQTESRVGSKPYFTLGGHKFLIFGGSIHYFRVPREYWRDRLLKLKACGFNTLTTYVPWNLHEPQRGKFDFSGNLDLECSPDMKLWLLQDPKMVLRTTYKGFVEAVNNYFDHLISRVVPLQFRKRGPIIAVQVENEYGSFAKDKDYMPYVQKALLERGIVELLMTSDDAKHRNKPIMVMEFWVGWFDTWGSEHIVKDAGGKCFTDAVSKFITSEISFNIYMFHGGTNFGFMNGATYFGKHRGVITSYDYDAVLTEAGDYTEKYFKLRKLFGSVVAMHLPPIPKLSSKAEYPAVKPSLYLPLWDVLQYLNKPLISHTPVNMESLPINNGNGQSYGFVLYETSICSGGFLQANVQDTAQVFLNEKNIGLLSDNIKELNIPKIMECQLLRILVENQGRVSFSWKIQDQRKGLTGPVTIDNVPLNGFIIYSLEMTMSFFERLRSASWRRPVPKSYSGPAFYLGTLKANSSPKDTFLRLPNWNYGFVFINGRNLGRYSIMGPQETLYLPGAWLHPKNNEIILFEKTKSGSYIKTIGDCWNSPTSSFLIGRFMLRKSVLPTIAEM
uniref:Galactosidase beta 1 like 3 n=1 Tax=Suricata suricatta TaxID=37032 RepID=A0A673U413_SURSU